jgi:single-stranded-DNA-specific exonuclease
MNPNKKSRIIGVSVTGKKWQVCEVDERLSLMISQRLGVHDIVGRILSSRGIDLETAENYLNPTIRTYLKDPSHLLDMDKAVDRLLKAIQENESIVIFGDYDVDGATSSAVLYRFLRSIGVKTDIYIPDRLEEGYGPNAASLLKFKEKGAHLVITLDCGTVAFEALSSAQKIGLDVIVIDHHSAEDHLPPSLAVINPNRLDEQSPYTYLAAVGLTYLFVIALNRAIRKSGWYQDQERSEPDLLNFLDLVALGTVCDVVPLKGLNRAFVTQGLKVLQARENIGLKALIDVGGVKEAPRLYHLGFVLGPRINSGGRVGKSDLGARLLVTDDLIEAVQISRQLENFNQERKGIEAQVLREATEQALSQETPFLLVYGDEWHPGVIGIVAGRLKERFQRPAAVIGFNHEIGKGSCRSILGFDLGLAVHVARKNGILRSGGGHKMAAGFTLEKVNLQKFHDFMCKKLTDINLTPVLQLDGFLTPRAVTSDFVNTLECMGPFGSGNPTPRFCFKDLRITYVDVVGGEHVRCTLSHLDGQRLRGIAFRCRETPLGQALLQNSGAVIDVVGTLHINTWRGAEQIQIQIEDIAWGHSATTALAG